MTRPSPPLRGPAPRRAGRGLSRSFSPLVGEKVAEGRMRGVSLEDPSPSSRLRMTVVPTRDPRPATRNPGGRVVRNFPPDVLVLGDESLVHARVVRGKKGLHISRAKSYRLPAEAFTPAVVTPELAGEEALAEVMRRVRMENGKIDRVSVLLPDSWFRINILDLPTLPAKAPEAIEMVRWTLKRTMPLDPQTLRVAYDVLSKSGNGAKVLVVSAVETTLAGIERVLGAAGCEAILIEPIGL